MPPDTAFAVRGSSIYGTGYKEETGKYEKPFFDIGRKSDHDVAVISRELLEKARENDVVLRDGGRRTTELSIKQTLELGLMPLLKRIQDLTGRKKTRLMIYRFADDLNRRGANLKFDLE